ncbi:nucleotidyltransferase domain-containing protein [Thermogladius sp. 4427co]|uniref:nucleotidyltransferase domain-containing protein n=1 Tax=Thermogladius sp. 4427co TaxID=3450718 RepID=UPI003F7AB6FA
MLGESSAGNLGEAVRILIDRFKPIAIILFGSRARGDYKPWSDYDILIIAYFTKPYLERLGEVLEALKDIPLPIEPHPYTLEEALNMLEKGNPIIVDALSEGRILYSTQELNKLLDKFSEMVRQGLRKTDTSIVLPRRAPQIK